MRDTYAASTSNVQCESELLPCDILSVCLKMIYSAYPYPILVVQLATVQVLWDRDVWFYIVYPIMRIIDFNYYFRLIGG